MEHCIAVVCVENTVESKKPNVMPANPCRMAIKINQPMGPWQGMSKTRKIKIKVILVCTKSTKNWVRMCEDMTSIGRTPDTHDRSKRPSCFSEIKASPVKATAKKNMMIIMIPGAMNSVKLGSASP